MPVHYTEDEYAYMSLLLKTIDSCDWQTLEHILRTNPKKFVSVANLLARSAELNGMTILHACIRFDPPPKIVQMIIRLIPLAPRAVDCLNRTPLHIAAGLRVNTQSIKNLIIACRDACAIQDADGKTPLHLACDVNCELFEGDEDIVRSHTSFEVIQYLALGSLESVPLEDEGDMSALEYAIISNADLLVVKFLMRLTQMQLDVKTNSLSRIVAGLDATEKNLDCNLMQKKHQQDLVGDAHINQAAMFTRCNARSVYTV